MIEIRRYTPADKDCWNEFVAKSKNATFLLNRNYMDYHSDRFTDFSLMAYDGKELKALLPANIKGDTLYSHQGLTYGGWITPYLHFNANTMLEVFHAMSDYLKANGVKTLIYKAIPHIFHKYPAEEDLYALFRFGARLIVTNMSSTIFYCCDSLPFSKHIVATGKRRARKYGFVVKQTDDYDSFWTILSWNLQQKYGVKPVHTLEEIKLLHSRFPENIKLYMLYVEDEPVAGCVIFEHGETVHLQYCSANEKGNFYYALSYLEYYLISQVYTDRTCFDMGISNEDDGKYLNANLLETKARLAGRGVAFNIYQLDL